MCPREMPSLDLTLIPVTCELKEADLEHVSAGLDKMASLASLGLQGMNFPSLSGS